MDSGEVPAGASTPGETSAPPTTTFDEFIRGVASAPAETVPTAIGRYHVRGRLGAGGMGVVYAAYDPQLERPVAIKVLRGHAAGDGELAGRLHREAQALARVTHPNVVAVYDVGVAAGAVHVVMQQVDGTTLDRALAARAHTTAEIVARFVDAGRGLAAVHAAGLMHRDFKPTNVLVDRAGVVRITDFGLAARFDADEVGDAGAAGDADDQPAIAAARLTRTGAVMGTPAYMAPEQHAGARATAASDQFSFCVALWEALSGRRPFAGDTTVALAQAIAVGAVGPSPRPVPRRIAAILRRGLAADPAARWPAMDALLTELAAAARPRRRWPWAVAALGVSAALTGGALALTGRAGRTGALALPVPRTVTAAAARPLTQLGECARRPAFLDDATVVFERASDAGVDLWRVPVAGGTPTQLTALRDAETHPARGATADELVYAATGAADAIDLASGRARHVAAPWGPIVYRDGAYYRAPRGTGELRRSRDGTDQIVLQFPRGRYARDLVAGRTGPLLATVVSDHGDAALCAITVAEPATMRCYPGPASAGRPALSSDGAAAYLATPAGIARLDLATGALTVVVPGVDAGGGIAVAPGGGALAFSSCGERWQLRDVTAGVGPIVIDEPGLRHPALGPDGWLAYVRVEPTRQAIVVRQPDGSRQELVSRSHGQLSDLAFIDGVGALAYVVSDGDDSGLYLTWPRPGRLPPRRLTRDPGDARPVALGDRVAFTRWSPEGVPQARWIVLEGTTTGVIAGPPRVPLGTAGDRLLLADAALVDLTWWDFVRGRDAGAERRGDALFTTEARRMVMAPRGAWLAALEDTGAARIKRLQLPAATAAAAFTERIPLPTSVEIGALVIDDAGRVLAQVASGRGELAVVPPPAGRVW